MKISKIVLASALVLLVSSCYYNKRLIYLQDKHFSEFTPTLAKNKKSAYHLQPSDVLSVQIKGSTETDASNAIFNVASRQSGMFASPGSLFLEGYTIDVTGKITLPILGEMTVKDLTVEEVQRLVQDNANKYLNKSTVIVKLTSFKVTILGEVKSPGYFYVFNSQVTLLEALGLAGDLTLFANRKNVKLIRQVPGATQVVLLNLTDPGLLSSEYFFLMPNDVLYVEPLRARARKTNLDILSIIFAGLTTAAFILYYVKQK